MEWGDRVAGYLPNRFETLIAFLATASLGAIWSNCPPELSSRGVVDRLSQIEPKVLVAVSGYRYGGKSYDRTTALAEITANLPTLRHVIVVEQAPDERVPDCSPAISAWRWSDLLAQQAADSPLRFDPVPFDHPLWILYSSGTTGMPKPIVHGHGGILLEHLKALSFHLDLRPADKFFWFTTAGWMMWNFLVSGLALGALPVLYDGSPKYPDLRVLWRLIERRRDQLFRYQRSVPDWLVKKKSSSPERSSGWGRCDRSDRRARHYRTMVSNGCTIRSSPSVWLGSVSGGTDVCTAFVLSHPWLACLCGKTAVPRFGRTDRSLGREW